MNNTEEHSQSETQEFNGSEDIQFKNNSNSEFGVSLSHSNRINLTNMPPMYSEPETEPVNANNSDDGYYSPKEGYSGVKEELKFVKGTKLVQEMASVYQTVAADKNNPQNQTDPDLPEGWVRCGKGLRMEFPNTPRNDSDNSLESKNLFINFTDGCSPIRSEKSLQSALMNLDRTAVRELKGGMAAIKSSRSTPSSRHGQSSSKLHPSSATNTVFTPTSSSNKLFDSVNRCAHISCNRANVLNRRSNTAFKVPSYNIADANASRRNNTYSTAVTDVELLKAQHKKDMELLKHTLLSRFRELVEKYRELAVDAINAARNEQKKCQKECKLAYSTAYNACVKYEKDLKNTIRFALKEYQNSNQNYQSVVNDKNALLRKCEDVDRTKAETALANHRMLREDLAQDYQLDEQLLVKFEPKIVEKFNHLLNQLSLYLEDNFNLNHKDSTEFVKSVISNNL